MIVEENRTSIPGSKHGPFMNVFSAEVEVFKQRE